MTLAATLIVIAALALLAVAMTRGRMFAPQRRIDIEYGAAAQASVDEAIRRRWVGELGAALEAHDWERVGALHRKMSGFSFDG